MENNARENKRLAIVRVRGLVNLRHDIKETFEYLNLRNKNWCIVAEDRPTLKGMVAKVKDYVTWGELSDETFGELVSKRGKEEKGEKALEYKNKKYQKFFRLNSPVKGYGRKGVKIAFSKGGALGYRGENINDLIKRMI